MQLQKVKTREYKGKTYYRWQITVPSDTVEQAGWSEGDELEAKVTDAGVLIRKA